MEGCFLRRGLILLLCLSLLAVPVRGAEAPKYVALTFDDGPSGRFTRNLLQDLKQVQVRGKEHIFQEDTIRIPSHPLP